MNNPDKLIDRIKKENIRQVPKWYFQWKKGAVWTSYIFFLLIGSISFSVVLFTIQQSEFALLSHINDSFLELILVLLPILWLILLILFLAGSILSAKNSDKGYKLSFGKWLALSTGLSIVAGTLFFISGGAQWVENSFANQVELYQSVQEKKISIWSQPENGTLSGEVLSADEGQLQIRDFSGSVWTIVLPEEVFIAPRALLEKGQFLKINGTILEDHRFEATEIRPWGNNSAGKGQHRKGQQLH